MKDALVKECWLLSPVFEAVSSYKTISIVQLDMVWFLTHQFSLIS